MPATSYRNVRRFLHPRYRNASDRMIERVVEAQGLQARAIEDFWDDVGNFVASALPAVGGAIGSVIAPGVGTAIGAGLGSAAGSALHGAIGPGQPAAPAAPSIPMPMQQPGAAGATGSSQQLAALLLQLLSRPELLQAVLQMLLGSAGNRTVSVPAAPATAATPAAAVPVSAFTNLLGSLAGQISEAYNAENAFSPAGSFAYGAGPWGSHVDMASAESRGAALMNLLQESGDGGPGAALRYRQRKQRLAELAQALHVVAARRASGAHA